MNSVGSKRLLLDAIIIAFLLLFPHYVPLPFYSYAIVCMLVIIVYLKSRGKSIRDLGLKEKGLTLRSLVVGIGSGVLWVAFVMWVYNPLINRFFIVPAYTEYDFIRQKLSHLVFTIIAAWIVGGLYEEIVFRGFIQTTVQQWLQKQKQAFWIAGFLTSILFGLYHAQQGIFGMVPAFLGGLMWTFLLWRYNGNLWVPVLSHAIYDTIALVLIYNNTL